MTTFAELGILFPLYEAPTTTADDFAAAADCALCGATAQPGFRLGIGDDWLAPCSQCSRPVSFDAEEPKAASCVACAAVNEPTPQMTPNGTVCYACLRDGKAAMSKDTVYGLVTWEQAVEGVTHGVPRDVLPIGITATETVLVDDDWVAVRVPDAHLWELLRTPTYLTWQGEQWQFCCGAPMTYVGEWQQPDWNRAADEGNGKELFASVLTDADPDLWDWAESGTALVYVFRCRSCAKLKAHWDCD